MDPTAINILWDIETGPLPDEQLEAMQRATSKELPKDKLALNAHTGQILAIGMWQDGHRSPVLLTQNEHGERDLLEKFMWQICGQAAHADGKPCTLIGFNTLAFDLPFVLRRMWAHGMMWEDDYPLFGNFQQCDLMLRWRDPVMGGEPSDRISLAALTAHLGVNLYKTGRGADFAATLEADPEAAKRYLANDLRMTAHCAARMIPDLRGCFRNIIQPTEE
jgi:hypothetical protein